MSYGPRRAEKTLKLTYLALMTAMVVVCELLSIFVGGIFTITFALVPIVIGAAICGPWGGAWLGGVFSVIVLASGKAAGFYGLNPVGTIVTVLLKGIFAGLAAGFVYYLFSKSKKAFVSKTVSAFGAAIAAPVVNTATFVLGCFVFFYKALETEAGGGLSATVAYVLFGVVGVNFFIELGINLLLAPVIIRLLDLLNKKAFKR